MAEGSFSDFFGPFDPMGLTPEMGRLLATNPEAVIPHLAAAGVPPPSDGGMMDVPGVGPVPGGGGAQPAPAPTAAFGGGQGPFNPFGDVSGLMPFVSAGGPASATQPPAVPSPDSASAEGTAAPVPLPRADPRKAQAQGGLQDTAKNLLSALSGVRMPPGPQVLNPQVRPHTAAGPAVPSGSPIAAMLGQVLSGTMTPDKLRLLQAIGKEGR